MIADCAILSEKGPRPDNEDAAAFWRLDDDCFAAAIADGLGGHNGGKLAAEMAISLFGEAVTKAPPFDLARIALKIHGAIRGAQEQQEDVREMATTFSAAVLRHGVVSIVHSGDTRIALQRGIGIRRLTSDHTEAQRLLSAGKINKQEFSTYPRKNVLESALGIAREPIIELFEHELRVGDKIILTSDGVHGKVYLREIRDICVSSKDAATLVSTVGDLVQQRGPDDNYTIAAIFLN